MAKRELVLEMNRVEGDLQVKLEITDGVVSDAWTVGTMYRGFEQLMIGRAPMDALVITPRVCGICGTAHLYAAATAIETAIGCPIAPNGTRVRNACLMAEETQSDTRHAFLMFMIDLCNPRYAERPGYAEIVEAFAPFKGRIYRETVVETKKILEIVAIFGGQWPHSSHMVPGGVVTQKSRRSIVKCLGILDAYTRWYERSILGCSVERWLAVQSVADLERWLEESELHRKSAMGLYLRFTRELGFAQLGRGRGNMLSYGVYFDPELWQPPFGPQRTLRAAGFYDAELGSVQEFDHRLIAEHVKHSFFRDYDGGQHGQHPWRGETVPQYDPSGPKYSWAKAPRYDGKVVEVGCFAELFMAGDPLMRDVFAQTGTNVWGRQLSRLHRPALTLPALRRTLLELDKFYDDSWYDAPKDAADGEGVGLVQAARGALGHWVQFQGGQITRYQLVTPTAWNASPRDSGDVRGHWEESLVGLTLADDDNPVELGHVIRSHDACLVCTVHFLDTKKSLRFEV
jgi:uptake hydrogenase large subunit